MEDQDLNPGGLDALSPALCTRGWHGNSTPPGESSPACMLMLLRDTIMSWPSEVRLLLG